MYVYSPASITSFFVIEENGSSGVSICLNEGVSTIIGDGTGIYFNGEVIENSLQENILNIMNKNCKIESVTKFPISQGLGISAGAVLSTAFALNEHFNLNKTGLELAKIAHEVEVKNRTGLGDVCAQFNGGVLWRRSPGLEDAKKMLFDDKIVIAVVGNPIVTKDVIDNQEKVDTINKIGRECFSKMYPEISLNEIIKLGRKFSESSGLITDSVKNALQDGDKYGTVSMAMLGNTVYGIGDVEKLSEVWRNYGEVFILEIDKKGARVLK